jgi:hypothetical protein
LSKFTVFVIFNFSRAIFVDGNRLTMSAHIFISLDSVETDVEYLMLLAMHFSLLVVTDTKAAANFDAYSFSIRLTSFI